MAFYLPTRPEGAAAFSGGQAFPPRSPPKVKAPKHGAACSGAGYHGHAAGKSPGGSLQEYQQKRLELKMHGCLYSLGIYSVYFVFNGITKA